MGEFRRRFLTSMLFATFLLISFCFFTKKRVFSIDDNLLEMYPILKGNSKRDDGSSQDSTHHDLNGYKFSCKNCNYGNTSFDASRSNVPLNGDEILIYKAYYDWRDAAGPRIRLLTIGECNDLRKNTTQEEIKIQIGNTILKIGWLVPGRCPEYSCKHIAADITSISFNEKPTEEIIVQRGTKSVKLKLNFVPKNYQPGITSCLEPLYWFTEWPRLIVFIELYQMIGYTKFLFTWTSMTKNVKKVLDYYVSKGLAELQPYPLMPYTDTVILISPFYKSKFSIDFNNSTYHMGEHLVEQHCAFSSTTKYSSMNDIDDFFYHRNQTLTLYEWMESIVKNQTNVGSFAIKHYGLQWKPQLIPRPFNFESFLKLDGLKNPIIFNNDRANKALFLTEFAREPFTHWVERFFKDRNFYGTKPNEIVYLHARNSFEGERLTNEQLNGTKNLMPDVDLLGKNSLEKLERIRTVIREIFGENPAPFTHETNDALDDCLKNWEVRQKGCRKPVTGCFEAVRFMEEWVFAESTNENKWTVL